jgi:DNA-binding transcriptional LysR family regulator
MNLRNVDLNLLVAFDALVEECHVTRAAERIAMSQPAMSNALGRLRKQFNDPILVRTNRGMEPTLFSTSIAQPVKLALRDISVIINGELRFDPNTSTKTFTLAIEDFLISSLAIPLFHLLRRQAPFVKLKIKQMICQTHKPLLDAGVDAGITYSFRDCSRTKKSPLFSDDLVVVARKDHPNAKSELSLKEFTENFDHIVIERERQELMIGGAILGKFDNNYEANLRLPPEGEITHLFNSDFVMTWPRQRANYINRTMNNPLAVMELPCEIKKAGTLQMDLYWPSRIDHDPANQWFRENIRHLSELEFPNRSHSSNSET